MVIEILTGNPFFASCLASSILLLVWKFVRKDERIHWAHAMFPPLWSVGSTMVLGISASALPVVLDRYLYLVDGSFGFQASFAGARFLLANPWLLHTCAICYLNLPIAMTVMYLLLMKQGGPEAANGFMKFAIFLAISGTTLYFACPAVGPGGAFHADFPNRLPQAVTAGPMTIGMAARNCMPSMHTAWILCLLLCAPAMPRWGKAILWAFSGFTLLYALSAGGHYLVDLVVAVPFTLAVRSGMRSEWRAPGFSLNAAIVLFWFVAIRYGVGMFTLSPAVPYGLSAVALLSPLWSRPIVLAEVAPLILGDAGAA